uniref:Uncharacterized protein LOC105033198 isoform X2 n=1 Tax=Elaeis guineensis var. tenera TaxID=51953 RepID=A0A8N4ESW6_ELAGV|nr:uncharacterized protein LOC105033198 isoform X2 [Elaeis guineensis]
MKLRKSLLINLESNTLVLQMLFLSVMLFLAPAKGNTGVRGSPHLVGKSDEAKGKSLEIKGKESIGVKDYGGSQLEGDGGSPSRLSSSPPRGQPGVAMQPWNQVVQEQRRFCWESLKVSKAEIAVLESIFQKAVGFTEEDIQGSLDRWKFVLIPAEQERILAQGPWTLVGQILALGPWHPGFRPGCDKISKEYHQSLGEPYLQITSCIIMVEVQRLEEILYDIQ